MLPVHFAPLQGYTDAPYRSAHAAIFGGVEAYYTPFVRIERNTFRPRDVRNLEKSANSGFRLIPQIIASTAEECKMLVEMVAQKGYSEVDINMGCPFPMITNKHKGSGILSSPNMVDEVLAATREFAEMRVSVKMRLGQADPNECLNLLPILNAYKLQHITMHPRIGVQQYKGDCNFDVFTEFYNQCTNPLIFNGDICTIVDIAEIERRFPKLSAVMIGRGLLANPALAIEYKNGAMLDRSEYLKRVRQFHTNLLTIYESTLNGDAQILEKMKSFWEYLLPDGEKKFKKRIAKTTSLNNYKTSVDALIRG